MYKVQFLYLESIYWYMLLPHEQFGTTLDIPCSGYLLICFPCSLSVNNHLYKTIVHRWGGIFSSILRSRSWGNLLELKLISNSNSSSQLTIPSCFERTLCKWRMIFLKTMQLILPPLTLRWQKVERIISLH